MEPIVFEMAIEADGVGGIQKRRELGWTRKLMGGKRNKMQKRKPSSTIVKKNCNVTFWSVGVWHPECGRWSENIYKSCLYWGRKVVIWDLKLLREMPSFLGLQTTSFDRPFEENRGVNDVLVAVDAQEHTWEVGLRWWYWTSSEAHLHRRTHAEYLGVKQLWQKWHWQDGVLC